MASTDQTTPAEPHAEEAQLIAAVQSGEAQAFAALLDRHLDSIHAFVALRLPIAHLVDEITHESFVFAFHHLSDFTPGTSFRAWLRAIAANKVRAEVERYGREERNRLAYSEQRALELAVQEPGSAGDGRALEALQDCLHQVPSGQRDLLHLKYHDEVTSEEMARRMGRSVAWVRTTLCRLRQQLRECVERKLRLPAS
jgi:RNA polymerase sigma-70 factor